MPAIRNLAVGLPLRDGYVLAQVGHDSEKGSSYLRAIGGGIEFGETAQAAVRREFLEELEIELDMVQLLGVVENHFDYEGEPGHEIVHVFSVASKHLDSIPLDQSLTVLDEGSTVAWFDVSRMEIPLYPEGSLDLLEGWEKSLKKSGEIDLARKGSLHHVELWVPDIQRAKADWGWMLTRLGYRQYQVWDNGISWLRGNTYLVVEESSALTRKTHQRTDSGLNHLAFHAGSEAEVDALMAESQLHGWKMLFADKYPHAGGPDSYAAYLVNSDGFEIELVATR